MHYCPSALEELLNRFQPCFSRPAFRHFSRLVLAWILLQGTHTISRMISLMRRFGLRRHHSSVYRFLAQAKWKQESVGKVVFDLLRPLLSSRVQVIVDDTLCAKSGRQVFGVGIHHDAARSTYGAGRRIEVLTFGHVWVVLAVYIPCPWKEGRGWAIPVLFDLYRSPKRCPAGQYRKRSAIALAQIREFEKWLAPTQRLVATGDSAYCCKTVLRGLSKAAHFVGPLPLSAALYDTVGRLSGQGRPRRKGYRIANPRTRLTTRTKSEWKEIDVVLYGRTVRVCYATLVCVWYPSAGTDPVRVVMIRDPKNQNAGRAYVSTDPSLSAHEILETYARRWQLEVTFREIKQELGFEDPQNGWWRRPAGKRDDPCRPARRKNKGKKAVERTAPLAGTAYALIIIWYVGHGRRHNDIARVKRHAPWYRNKDNVSFADMRNALRLEFWRTRLPRRIRKKATELWLMAGNAA